jgi:uncharacterized protein (DUF1330 family)
MGIHTMKKLVTGGVAAIILAFANTSQAQDAQPHGYMIANYEIKDQATFQKYMEAAGPLAPKYGGKVIVFNLKAPAVEGHPKSVMAIALAVFFCSLGLICSSMSARAWLRALRMSVRDFRGQVPQAYSLFWSPQR